MSVIAIVGPQRAASLLDEIASAVRNSGHTVLYETLAGSLLDVPGIAGAEILLTAAIPCGAKEMDAMPQLRGIVSPLLGYDWIDVAEASKRGIPVVNGEVNENREGMAEATILLVLALLYRLQDTENALRSSSEQAPIERRMLKGRTVGIIGYGGIAQAVIARLVAWECKLMVSTRSPSPSHPSVDFVPLTQLLSASEVIILLTGLEPATRHMLGADQFAMMMDGAILINTARGGLIQEQALLDALRSGKLAAAALDVFEQEPLPADHALREFPNVILTPHAIGHTKEAREAVPREAVSNLLCLAQGALPSSCRNASAVKAPRR